MELTVEGLTKHYGSEWALREVSLRCEPSLVGLVGPNGAGKTTLLRIVATLLRPSAGVVRWKGQDIATHGRLLRAVLGYLRARGGPSRPTRTPARAEWSGQGERQSQFVRTWHTRPAKASAIRLAPLATWTAWLC